MSLIIHTAHLFPQLDQRLIQLLRSLSPEEWHRPTVAKMWSVKDVASHLLDGNLRAISMLRDGFSLPPDREIHSYADLVAFLNQLNADWVKATRRLSPQVLTDMLELTGKQYSELMQQQDLNAEAPFSVAWAGETISRNWFHIAREYTEKWHHQQQIREATGRQGIMTAELFHPFIDTLLRGLPHTYRNTEAPTGTTVEIVITSGEEFRRFLVRRDEQWEIAAAPIQMPVATIRIPAEVAWKLFTKAISPVQAEAEIALTGDQELARTTLQLIAVMA